MRVFRMCRVTVPGDIIWQNEGPPESQEGHFYNGDLRIVTVFAAVTTILYWVEG